MENRSRLNDLFVKLRTNSCTPEETDELIALFSTEEPDLGSLELLHEQIEAPVIPGEIDEDVRYRLQKRLEQILGASPDTRPVSAPLSEDKARGRIFFGRFLRVAAAAVLLFTILTSGYYLFLPGTKDQKAHNLIQRFSLHNDVAPGSDKAILTLGDGRKIVLDSAGDGLLAEQGNTKIVKLDNGRLAYQPLSENVTEAMPEMVYNTLTTPAGGQYKLTLPDGSKVWLDASSSIIYPTAFAGVERKVEVSGQVYFEVAKDEKQPFIVKSRDMTVQVLGTRFNVNAYEDEAVIKTTLLDGSVNVIAGKESKMLDPGQQAQLNKMGGINVIKADVEETVAWKNGFFSFRHADIQTVMRQICRWYDVEVKYEGAVNKEKSYSGEIGRNLSLADVLNGLQLARIHYRIDTDKKLVILP